MVQTRNPTRLTGMLDSDRLARCDGGVRTEAGSSAGNVLHFDSREGRCSATSIRDPEGVGGHLREGATGIIKDLDCLGTSVRDRCNNLEMLNAIDGVRA